MHCGECAVVPALSRPPWSSLAAAANPEDIELAEDDGGEGEEEAAQDVDAPASAADAEVVQAAVPAAVFGSVAAAAAAEGAARLQLSDACSGLLRSNLCLELHAFPPSAGIQLLKLTGAPSLLLVHSEEYISPQLQ